MPGWHDATVELQRQGKLQMLGILQEQHADRARLFMQWKRMDWPLFVDSYNRLGTSVVPITLLIDEHGIVRHQAPTASRAGEMLREFLATTYDPPPEPRSRPEPPALERLVSEARAEGSAQALRALADGLALWGGDEDLERALEARAKAIALAPDHAATHFRLGVTYRRSYDSPLGNPADFTRAVESWARALDLDPNNYIWRRRIQQYGPRLGKPYPFYDWVVRARKEIEARGEMPVALGVEPRGAELAKPAKSFEAAAAAAEPDTEGRILRDPGKYVHLAATLVPPELAPGRSGRVHLEFRPDADADAHWNNEAPRFEVWVEPPKGWDVSRRSVILPLPGQPVSGEPRHVELELRAPEQAARPAEIRGYALYYVCEGVGGACLYRRQDFSVPLPMADGTAGR